MTAPEAKAGGPLARAASPDNTSNSILLRSGTRCMACFRPTPRWSAICRQCLAAHYRLDGLIRSYEILTEAAS